MELGCTAFYITHLEAEFVYMYLYLSLLFPNIYHMIKKRLCARDTGLEWNHKNTTINDKFG